MLEEEVQSNFAAAGVSFCYFFVCCCWKYSMVLVS